MTKTAIAFAILSLCACSHKKASTTPSGEASGSAASGSGVGSAGSDDMVCCSDEVAGAHWDHKMGCEMDPNSPKVVDAAQCKNAPEGGGEQ